MRPVLALLVSVLLFSGVFAYTQFAESVRRPPLQIKPKFASGTYSIQIDRTFDCVGDEDWGDVASLVVKFRGAEVLRRTDTIPANELILIDPLEHVEQLENEVYVFANVTNASTDDDWDAEPAPKDDWEPAEQKIAAPTKNRVRDTSQCGSWQNSVTNRWPTKHFGLSPVR